MLVLAALGTHARDALAESMRARVRLFGACADTEALVRELARRGVELEVLSSEATAAPYVVALSVEVAPGGTHRAALTLLDASGARDDRTLDARDCREITAAAAWVLISLSRERKASPATTPAPEASVASFPEPPRGPVAVVASPPSAPRLDRGQVTRPATESAMTPPLRVGTAFALGIGLTDELATGAVLSLDYAAFASVPLSLRVAARFLSTRGIRAEEAVLSLERRTVELGVVLRPSALPLFVAAGVEGGLLSAGASGLSPPRDDSSGWFAVPIGAGVDLPLFSQILELHLGGGLAYTPLPYRFTASGATLERASQWEIRSEFGLSGRL